tara:strand:- start:276551 stop:277252 length:702 start_codon:yes stop_codon:yes gene_type:complete
VQSVKLLILFGLWLYAVASISFLVFPIRGELVGITIAVVYLVLIYTFIDKWILLFLLAVPAKRGDKLLEKLSNLSYGHNQNGLALFYSRVGIKNVICFEWRGKKIVIIDKDLNNTSNVENSFRQVITMFKDKTAKKNSRLMYLYSVYNLPVLVLERYFGQFWVFSLIVGIWTTPFRLIIDSILNKKLDQPEYSHNGQELPVVDIFTSEIIRVLGIYKCQETDLVSVIFNKEKV